MTTEDTTYVGLDVHKNSIHVAVLVPGRDAALQWTEVHTVESIRRLAKRLLKEAPGPVECCYEAGPTGYPLQRRLRDLGVGCTIIAPSLTPIRPGTPKANSLQRRVDRVVPYHRTRSSRVVWDCVPRVARAK